MFNFLRKSKKYEIYAPMNGIAMSVYNVPDEAFSSKMLGDGIAIVPSSGEIVSPVDGVVEQIVDTSHAYGIRSKDGLDILIHVGIDTVKLGGEGFEVFVRKDQEVKVGDLLGRVNLNILKDKGYNTHTPVIITNTKEVKKLSCVEGSAKAGSTVIMTYEK